MSIEKGNIIGEFDLYDYDLPITKCFLFHQVAHGDNWGNEYPPTRDYLRIIGFTEDDKVIEYGYVYFSLYTSEDGLPISQYIGSQVFEEYRGKGLGDLLMSIYLYYSYDSGFSFVESTTRQKKLDILALMNKYGFTVKDPEKYHDGEMTAILKNKMVVDIYKQNRNGLYYRFKTTKAEDLYRRANAKIAENYNYLDPLGSDNIVGLYKVGWVVPGEEYERTLDDYKIIKKDLVRSGFSK